MTDILYAAAMIGGVGLFVGIFLGFAGKVFAVKVNQKEKDILDVLPGANCGGCGYSGCAALAAAIARGEAGATSCVVGQEPVANQIRWIIGGKSERIVRNVAFVRCSGDWSIRRMAAWKSGRPMISWTWALKASGPGSASPFHVPSLYRLSA